MLCCFHLRTNRSARCTLACHCVCAASTSRAALRFASTYSVHSRNEVAHALRIIFWMHRATLTPSSRSLRAASRQRLNARNCVRRVKATRNRSAAKSFLVYCRLSSIKSLHSKNAEANVRRCMRSSARRTIKRCLRSVAVASDHRLSDEATDRCVMRETQRETTRRCLLHTTVCERHRMNAVLTSFFIHASMKRSALRMPACQRSCSVAASALRASTMSRHASNAAEALSREMRPNVHASIWRLREFSSTRSSHTLKALYAERLSMRDTTSCTRAPSSRHTRVLTRH